MNLEALWRDCAYLRDLLAQPEALESTLTGMQQGDGTDALGAELRAGRFRRVLLTGMGSSYWACRPLYLRLLEAGYTPVLAEAGELIHYERGWFTRETLVLAVSQSGRSAEIVRLLDLAEGRAEVLAVTNTPDSPLARRAAGMLLTRAGEESTVSCKTYLATLAGLEWLGERLLGRDPAPLAGQMRACIEPMRTYLRAWSVHVAEWMQALEGATQVFYAGRGRSLASAGTAGLITKESAHFPAEGMSAAAFRHGPFESLHAGAYVLVFEGEERTAELTRKLAADVTAAGARSGLVSCAGEGALAIPRCDPQLLPLMEILPVQMLTLALAALQGRVPGVFERASKVTAEE